MSHIFSIDFYQKYSSHVLLRVLSWQLTMAVTNDENKENLVEKMWHGIIESTSKYIIILKTNYKLLCYYIITILVFSIKCDALVNATSVSTWRITPKRCKLCILCYITAICGLLTPTKMAIRSWLLTKLWAWVKCGVRRSITFWPI